MKEVTASDVFRRVLRISSGRTVEFRAPFRRRGQICGKQPRQSAGFPAGYPQDSLRHTAILLNHLQLAGGFFHSDCYYSYYIERRVRGFQ
jgi:hypothetical protein